MDTVLLSRAMFTRDVLRDLALAEPRALVVSVYALTDPRDPANTHSAPRWITALRNGLAATSQRLESGGARDDRLAFRKLRERIEDEMTSLDAPERARSVAWFVGPDGDTTRLSLQLPLRDDRVVADTKPFISPLVDVADRGARTGVIMVGSELVRVAQIEQAEFTEPEDSTYELMLGDWRSFGGTAGGSPARGLLPTAHEERYRARVEAQQDQLFRQAAEQTAKRLHSLGWERIALIAERQVASRFREQLGAEVVDRLIVDAELNLAAEEPAVIADALQPLIEAAWARRTGELIQLANDRARAGGAATIGAEETLTALAEGRVHHLVLDPDHDFSSAAGAIPSSIGARSELVGERAVEAAIGTSALVSVFPSAESRTLREAGGIAALLRY
jgi:hypothetical protein